MDVKLSPELERLIAEKVTSGEFRSADEVISKGLELLRERVKAPNGDSLKMSADLAALFQSIASEVPDSEWARVPSDLAANLDHYLYHPKKSSGLAVSLL